MTKLYLILPLALALLAPAHGADGQRFAVGVNGMTWGSSCTKAVRETLSKLENVAQVDVDFPAKTALVTMKKGSLTKEAVDAAFKGTRYSMASLQAVPPPPPQRTYTIAVSGMTWGSGCEARVRAILTALDNVDKVAIDYDKKTAGITMKPGTALSREVVAAAMQKSGRYGLVDFKETTPPPKKPAVAVAGISGMTWTSCAASVREALSKLEGVKEVSVNAGAQTATITLAEGAVLTKETVAAALDGTPYKVTSFEIKEIKT